MTDSTNIIKKNKSRIFELDILRGLAALTVALFHISLDIPKEYITFSPSIFSIGSPMPSLFFIISGFVIFMTIEKIKDWKEFVLTRFFRLYPSFWISIFLSLIFVYFLGNGNMPSSKVLFANITMIPDFFRQPLIVGSYWTLYIEIEFYIIILIAYCLKLIPRINATILFLLLVDYILHFSRYYNEHIFIVTIGLIPFLSQAHFFIAGIIFYQLKMYPERRKDYKLYVLLLLCLLFTFIMHGHGGKVFYFFNLWQEFSINSVFFFIFLLFAFDIPFLPNSKTLKLFGIISYNFYLLHDLIGGIIMNKLCKNSLPPVFALGLTILLIGCMSYWICFYIEHPIMRFSKKAFRKEL